MRLLYILTTFLTFQISLGQQGLYITSGGALYNDNKIITVLNGDFVNKSTTTLNGGTLQMIGTDAQPYRIVLHNENTFDNLEFYGTSTVDLDGSLNLIDELQLQDTSNFNLATGSQLTIGSSAIITGESNERKITGADGTYIKTTRMHTAGAPNNFGRIGVETRNGSTSMGSTEIYRRYGSFDIDGNPTVSRYYEVNPTENSDLNLNVRFYLEDVDLNGLIRSDLAAFRSSDNGFNFTNEGGNAVNNFHSITNLNAFSIWSFADASTLSINTGDLAHSISIFPNPTNGYVNITTQFGSVINAIEIFNISGQNIGAPLLLNNIFDVGNLSDGIYFIKLHSQSGTVTKKLIVKK